MFNDNPKLQISELRTRVFYVWNRCCFQQFIKRHMLKQIRPDAVLNLSQQFLKCLVELACNVRIVERNV